MDRVRNDATLVIQLTNGADRKAMYKEPVEDKESELSGFIPIKGKPRYTSIFVSGIMIANEDLDQTVKNVGTYMEKRGCTVKSARKIRDNGYTLSVKIVMGHKEKETVLDNDFWPEGIYCREWRN